MNIFDMYFIDALDKLAKASTNQKVDQLISALKGGLNSANLTSGWDDSAFNPSSYQNLTGLSKNQFNKTNKKLGINTNKTKKGLEAWSK